MGARIRAAVSVVHGDDVDDDSEVDKAA
jgi:hypothetical protein